MTTYDEAMAQLEALRGHSQSGFTTSDMRTIDELYLLICGKRVARTSCNDCYRDAYIETYLTLKRNGKMPNKPNYILKAGVVIHEFGSNDFYALGNCPDAVAEEWLRKDEKRIHFFETAPTDWRERVFKTQANAETQAKVDASKEATFTPKRRQVKAVK